MLPACPSTYHAGDSAELCSLSDDEQEDDQEDDQENVQEDRQEDGQEYDTTMDQHIRRYPARAHRPPDRLHPFISS